MLTTEQRRKIALDNLAKANAVPRKLKPKNINYENRPVVAVNRANLALRGLRKYLAAYMDNIKSVHDFDKWRSKSPGDALTWAHKVVYGDQPVTGASVGAGSQVNMLIQILTGQSNVPRGTSDPEVQVQVQVTQPVPPPQPQPIDIEPIHNAQLIGIPNDINELETEKS